jgi:Uma2 family endonuclease
MSMVTVEQPTIVAEDYRPARSSLADLEGWRWLENGERMDSTTFIDRYEHTPEDFRAELIEGVVYVMSSRVFTSHGRCVSLFSMLLGLYSAYTPGTVAQGRVTTVLNDRSVPEPDSAMLILEDFGGQSVDGPDGYTHGAPELVVEVAYSSGSIDLHGKLRDYERASVREYIVRDLRGVAVRWFVLRNGRFEDKATDADGVYRSEVFPGFWVDSGAIQSGDHALLIATLNRGLASPEHAAFIAELERRRADWTAERTPRGGPLG